MRDGYEEAFWKSYAENHFWRLNDKTRVKENSVYYDAIYDALLPPERSARILDIGCGGGHFLHYLVRKGYRNVEGIDIAPGLVEFVRTEIWPAVHAGDALEFLDAHPGAYDCLAANDFIEHLAKPRIVRFLFLCFDALAPGGRLLIKTPNMGNLFASRNRYVDFTHEVGFTEHSLYEVCAAAGFADIDIRSEFHASAEPKSYKWLRKFYLWAGAAVPKVLSTNLVAACRKP